MVETLLVRTGDGSWEELKALTTAPAGGVVDAFGRDVGPVLSSPVPIVVAAAAPLLATGCPDAICVDPAGGLWVLDLALDGDGATSLGTLLAHAGVLSGMPYDAFEQLCAERGTASLAEYVGAYDRAGTFHRGTFEVSVADALAHGRIRLVSVVSTASPNVVQSMRFLNAGGTAAALFEASTYASESVTAVRARAIDVGFSTSGMSPSITEMTAAGFVAVTGRSTDEATAQLMTQMQTACTGFFDLVRYDGDIDGATMTASIGAGTERADLLVATSDGRLSLQMSSLAQMDRSWTERAELCHALERLLGVELGNVKKIDRLDLSIGEHLMDSTLVDALMEILSDSVRSLAASQGADGAGSGSGRGSGRSRVAA